MTAWKSYPVTRLVLPFTAGIAIGKGSLSSILIPLLLAGVFFLSIYILRPHGKLQDSYRHRWIPGCLILLLLFLAGAEWASLRPTGSSPQHFRNFLTEKEHIILARLVTKPEVKDKSARANARVLAVISSGDSLILTEGKIRLNLAVDSLAPSIEYGDILWLSVRITATTSPENPSGFDYRKFLGRQDIYHQGWVKQGEWQKAGKGGNLLVKKAMRLRDHLESRLVFHGIKGDELGLASAILLGSGSALDQDLRQQYSDAGVTHILSVSGLHVGVVYLALNFILSFFTRNLFFRRLRPLVILAGIWGYAFLTGLSPSVLRAAFMLSMIIIGSGFRRTGNIFNSLACTAFILMIIDPAILSRAGFQLSFMAVIGIASFEPAIEGAWSPRNLLLDKAWQLVAVSIAAQLGTLPLSLYYFHSFPLYFLPANLVIIPVSSIVIYLGATLFLADQAGFFPGIIAWIFNQSLFIMNSAVGLFHSLPCSAIRPVFLSIPGMILLFTLLAVLAVTWKRRPALKVIAVIAIALAFSSLAILRLTRNSAQSFLVIYKSRNLPVADLISGRRCFCFADSAALATAGISRYTFGPFREDRGIREIRHHGAARPGNVRGDRAFLLRIRFHGKSMVILDRPLEKLSGDPGPPPDYLWVTVKAIKDKEGFLNRLNPGQVILDGTLPWKEENAWKALCLVRKTPLHSIREEGAFVKPL